MRRRYSKKGESRRRAGKQIERRAGSVKRKSDSWFLVRSEKNPKDQYEVIRRHGSWRCSCNDNFFNRLVCKHIQAVWARRRRLKRDAQRRKQQVIEAGMRADLG